MLPLWPSFGGGWRQSGKDWGVPHYYAIAERGAGLTWWDGITDLSEFEPRQWSS
jgi:hypothetical protein